MSLFDKCSKTKMHNRNIDITTHEYDEEGKVIRVKKETEKGIVTLQESRNFLVRN
jgi:hypothetical protein